MIMLASVTGQASGEPFAGERWQRAAGAEYRAQRVVQTPRCSGRRWHSCHCCTMSGSAVRDGRTAGLRRQAGLDDGRMYGTSDPGHQKTLRRLTDEEIKANDKATAAHYAAEVKLFMDGVNARVSTDAQKAGSKSKLWG
jgi:hypothetical protein|eukprot:COSAG06_NODE_8021_length_2298_cov_2.831742_2_plen_139_part_00